MSSSPRDQEGNGDNTRQEEYRHDWRHQIKKGSKPKFQVNQKVWFDPGGTQALEGPYLVASVLANGHFALCYDDGEYGSVEYAQDVEASRLRAA
ncbi:hypothetical protein J3459_010854 [Metarhizium acridum]|uniref:uncharacterized protein n=1 Tax=Metarhizium acridum TaxID=92637 RepID=UPI001C6C5CEE|nr:hypothetical protein J3458_019686 [Metarhizium acridum]KAG8420637.1 hypothetical protein J3459_010854 [Metarhizium acridum]